MASDIQLPYVMVTASVLCRKNRSVY